MPAIVYPNSRGFTLVEVLVALLVLAVGLLGSLIGVMAAVDHNLANDLYLEAALIAQERDAQLHNESRLTAVIPDAPATITRMVRKSNWTFTRSEAVQGLTSVRMTITVTWRYKGRTRTYTRETIL